MSPPDLAVAPPPTPLATEQITPPKRRDREAWWLGTLAFATYAALAAILAFHFHVIENDARSRVANGFVVAFGRDPHLAAVGFVWNPLPSLLDLPLLAVRGIWPALARDGFAGALTAAACMAGAVVEMAATLRELGASRVPRLILTALFALHPMVLMYAANGMSEAWLLFFVLLATHHLVRWVRTGATRSLAMTGLALAAGYLARYEALAAAIIVVAAVVTLSWFRTRRWVDAQMDGAIVAAPVGLAFVGWAAAGWLITGHPFEQFSSQYGNAAQIGTAAAGIHAVTGTGATAGWFALRSMLGLEPLLPAALVVALVIAWRRRDPTAVVAAGGLAAVLGFELFALVAGDTFGWLRFFIAVVPLTVVLAAPIATRRAAGLLVAVALVAPGFVAGAAAMTNPRVGREESYWLSPVTHPGSAQAAEVSEGLRTQAAVARYVDGLHAGRGRVLLDVAYGFAIVLDASDPTAYTITTDRDFKAVVADPQAFGVRYIVADQERADALNVAYPHMFDTGAGFSTMLRDFPAQGNDVRWRVYQVTPG